MIGALKELAPWILYIVWGLALVTSLSGRVKYGLFFLVPLLPLQNVVEKMQGLPFGKDLNDILLLAMIIGWVVFSASSRKGLMIHSSLNILLFFYFIYTYMSLYYGSIYLHESAPINPLDPRVQLWKNYMLLPLLFFLVANNLKTVDEFKKLLLVMGAGLVLMNYYNVQQIQDMTDWVSRAKVHGTFMWLGANEVAAFYATYTFVMIGLLLFLKEKKIKPILIIFIIMNFFIVLFIFSRAAYIAVLVALFFIAIVRMRILLLPLVIGLILWQTVLPQEVIQRIQFSEHAGELDESAQTRLVLWEQSILYFKESPLIGIGFNTFAKIGYERDTHNIYLKTLAEQGIIGILFLLSIMGIALRRGWRLYCSAEDPLLKGLGFGFSACVISLVIGNFFGDRWTALPLASHFWVFLGMVEAGNQIVRGSFSLKPDKAIPIVKQTKGRGALRYRA